MKWTPLMMWIASPFCLPGSALSQNADAALQQRVDDILADMSLTDKVGQMTQYTIDMVSVGEPYNLEEPHALDPQKMHEVFVDQRVGSILNVGGHAYTPEYWNQIIGEMHELAMGANGIPVLYGIDAIHGASYTLGATLYPQQIGLAATWNPLLVERGAEVTAYETRASAIPWTFSPALDIGRDPRWSRMWEGFGEDVHLATRMGVAMVRGYEGDDIGDKHRVASCMKHYLGYSLPNTGKDRTQAWVPERQLREYVLPPFAAAVAAGAATIMINSGDVNGIPAHASSFLLKDILRDELGFEGIALTDWEDIPYLYTRHRIAKDFKDAIRIAINAGIDMAMVPMDTRYPTLLKELAEEGAVPMERIDEAVRRVLTLKLRLGLFENPMPNAADYDQFNSAEHVQVAYNLASESITLLKNSDDVLPLSIGTRLLVTGPTADNMNYLNGGWTWTWQGNDAQYHPAGKPTFLAALQQKFGEKSISYVLGASIDEPINIQAAVEAAANVDVIVACLGESTYTEKPGDISDLTLPVAQLELVEALAETGKPIVLVMAQGRPRIINRISSLASAIVYTYLPGLEGGYALADILAGTVNPSGKLPFTYPNAPNDIVPYDHRGTDRIDRYFGENAFQPEFEFGHGLSYTTFVYSNLTIDKTSLAPNETISVSVVVTNTGDRAGKEVVQLYSTDLVASVAPSVKRLRAFSKIELTPGNSETVTFAISTRDLAFVGVDYTWVTEPGEFEFQVGGLTAKFELTE